VCVSKFSFFFPLNYLTGWAIKNNPYKTWNSRCWFNLNKVGSHLDKSITYCMVRITEWIAQRYSRAAIMVAINAQNCAHGSNGRPSLSFSILTQCLHSDSIHFHYPDWVASVYSQSMHCEEYAYSSLACSNCIFWPNYKLTVVVREFRSTTGSCKIALAIDGNFYACRAGSFPLHPGLEAIWQPEEIINLTRTDFPLLMPN